MHIKELMSTEIEEIQSFLDTIEEYGHIFYGDKKELEGPFKKIIEGIEEVIEIIDDYYSY